MFEVKMSKAGVSAIRCKAVTAPLAHGIHQARQKSLGYGMPFLQQPTKELLSVGGQMVVFPNSASKFSPQMLYWIQIGAVSRPHHAGNPCLMHESVDGPASVWRGIVVLKDSCRPNLLQGWDNQRSKNFIQVPLPRQHTVHMVKGGSVMPADSPPNHDGSASKRDHFLDCIGGKLLPWTPPDACLTITG
jgi:hypothetical protein